jgi:predicted O-methyltransferase YrrM
MKSLIDDKLEKYIEDHTSPESPVLVDLTRETHLKTYYPRMLAGNVQGKFLEMIVRMLKPERILEIGTFTGYSAIALASGLPATGKLITIEVNEEMESLIRSFIQKAGLESKINLLIGDAISLIPELNEQFDLVFIDADKEQYTEYYKLAMEKLSPGGFILADNVLWSGKVVEPDSKSDKETKGIKLFNETVKNDPRVEQVMLSVRDGLMLIRKL